MSSCKQLCDPSVHEDRKTCDLVVVPAGAGVWTGPYRHLSAAERCVDMADGMMEATLVFDSSRANADPAGCVVCQEGSSVVTTAEDDVRLSAGDSLLVPEQSWWVQVTDTQLTCS